MDKKPISSTELQRAREIAGGPLGDELAKYPMRFATSMIIWGDEGPGSRRELFNATVTLVSLGPRLLGVTCSHVISAARKLAEEHHRVGVQVGSSIVNLEEVVLSESRDLDLTVLDLTYFGIKQIVSGGPVGNTAFLPHRWPALAPAEGEPVLLGGFPGKLRRQVEVNTLIFPTFSAACVPVCSVSPSRLIIQFEREYWVGSNFDGPYEPGFSELGGLSGGPVFAQLGLAFDLVGIITEFSSDFDVLFATPVTVLGNDGSILGRSEQ